MSQLSNALGSKTIWGLIILIVNMFLKETPISEEIGQELEQALLAAVDAIGALVVLWGRITAKGPLFDDD